MDDDSQSDDMVQTEISRVKVTSRDNEIPCEVWLHPQRTYSEEGHP